MSLVSLEYVHVECRMKSSKFILKKPLSINPFISSSCSLTKRSAHRLPGRDAIFFWLVQCCSTSHLGLLVLVIVFVQHHCCFDHCFNFGAVNGATLFLYQSFFDFGVVICVMLLLWLSSFLGVVVCTMALLVVVVIASVLVSLIV